MLQIRKLEPRDIPAASALAMAHWPDCDRVRECVPRELNEMFSGSVWRPTYFVAELNGDIIGFAGWNYSWINYDIYEFCWCNVAEPFRHQGIGRRLVVARLADIRAQANGKNSYVMCTTNLPQIYARYGFASVGEFDLWQEGVTHLMMMKLDQRDLKDQIMALHDRTMDMLK